jgi:hypothetical protein
MTETYWILDESGEPKVVARAEWASWYPDISRRHLAVTPIAGEDAEVSTVFLSFDQRYGDGPPVLWETLVFGGRLDGEMERYTSRADALRGHEEMVRRCRAAVKDGQ